MPKVGASVLKKKLLLATTDFASGLEPLARNARVGQLSVDSGAQVISAGKFDATTFEVQTSDSRFSAILKNGIFVHDGI